MKKFPDSAFEEFVNQEFGEQVVESLKLCAMLKREAEGGGYHVDGQIELGVALYYLTNYHSIASF